PGAGQPGSRAALPPRPSRRGRPRGGRRVPGRSTRPSRQRPRPGRPRRVGRQPSCPGHVTPIEVPVDTLRIAQVDAPEGSPTRLQLGGLLVRAGVLSPEQLEAALADKEQTGRRLGEILLDRGWVEAAEIAKALAQQHGLEYIDFADTVVESAAV